MKHSGILFIMAFVLSACGSSPAPTPTPNFQETVQVLSSTMVAATMAALPTSLPTSTETPLPTLTSLPTETIAPITPTSSELPTASPEPTSTPWSGTLSPGNTEGLPTGLLRVENNTGVKEITITLTGVTLTRDQPVYIAYKIAGSQNLTILWARYKYVIQIPGKGIYQGTFTQNSKDKTTIRVFVNKIIIVGP